MVRPLSSSGQSGVTLTELMVTVAILGIVMMVGPKLAGEVTKFWRLQTARINVQRSARNSMDAINRHLRQATASSIVVSSEVNQPPFSSIRFTVDRGTGVLVGSYKVYQNGSALNFVNRGSTSTIAGNLRYIAFSYPRSDNSSILSISMTFEESTYSGYSKALQLSIEKVRIMN